MTCLGVVGREASPKCEGTKWVKNGKGNWMIKLYRFAKMKNVDGNLDV
jgi:hypothetical protein